jgi:hypothetical protein
MVDATIMAMRQILEFLICGPPSCVPSRWPWKDVASLKWLNQFRRKRNNSSSG